MIQLDLFAPAAAAPIAPEPYRALRVPPWTSLPAWLAEIERQSRLMRCATPNFRRFDDTARQLTPARIRVATNRDALDRLASWLDQARRGGTGALHWLDRVWDRAELGPLIVETGNRRQLLAMGRLAPREKGPRFDPRCLPADRLDALIQRHPDMTVVDACRAERARRSAEPDAPPAPIATTPARERPLVVAAIHDLMREAANRHAADDRRRIAFRLGAGSMLAHGYAKGCENEPKKYQRDFLRGAGEARQALWCVDHADEGFSPLPRRRQPAGAAS